MGNEKTKSWENVGGKLAQADQTETDYVSSSMKVLDSRYIDDTGTLPVIMYLLDIDDGLAFRRASFLKESTSTLSSFYL